MAVDLCVRGVCMPGKAQSSELSLCPMVVAEKGKLSCAPRPITPPTPLIWPLELPTESSQATPKLEEL